LLVTFLTAAIPALAESATPAAMGPLRLDPARPHYFVDATDRPVYLTGAHTWNNLQDIGETHPPAPFDYPGYLAMLRDQGMNFIRLWRLDVPQWDDPMTKKVLQASPHPWRRTGPRLAADGLPQFDLHAWDDAYFTRLRARVEAARSSGIYVSVMLFEGWVLQFAPDAWRHHPFNAANNVNGIEADQNGDGRGREYFTLADPAVTRLQEAYVRRVIDTLNDLDNVLFEISNENHWDSFAWEMHLVRFIRDYERSQPMQHPVGLTSNGGGGQDDTERLFASSADWISPNALSVDYRTAPPVANGGKVILLDTDHLWGVGGDRAWVWKSFLRGHNPIFMDPYRGHGFDPQQEPQWAAIRRAMGHTAEFARLIDLRTMNPQPSLASSGYCLADAGREYLVYVPPTPAPPKSASLVSRTLHRLRTNSAPEVTIDLSAAAGPLQAEWFNPEQGERVKATPVPGGRKVKLTAPFTGDAVLHLRAAPTVP
jgi:hypothetical protein